MTAHLLVFTQNDVLVDGEFNRDHRLGMRSLAAGLLGVVQGFELGLWGGKTL
jgi:hypothetical protein